MTKVLEDLGETALADLAAVVVLPVIRSVYALLVSTGLAVVDGPVAR